MKPFASGQTFIIIDDSGIDAGNRKRWVGDTSELITPGEVRKGDRCSFLPGTARKTGALPRAHEITILPKAK